jgi:biopolymer transport protein ExbD
MVTANYINQRSIEVKLPKAETGATTSETKNVSLTLDQAGMVYVDGVVTNWDAVSKKITEALEKNGSTMQAIITADMRTSHGDVVKLIDTVRKSGISDFALNVDSVPSPSNP